MGRGIAGGHQQAGSELCPKAPSTSGVQTNLGLLSEVMRHPSLVSCRARGRRRPTFFVSVARPRPPLLSDGRGVR